MRARVLRDPLALDPDDVAWHQLHTFVPEPRTFLERLRESPYFRGAPTRGWGHADWIRLSGTSPCSTFPLGRVTVHSGGILLDAFSEARLEAMRRRASTLGGGKLTPDETRSFPLEHVLAHPRALMQPLSVASSPARAVRDVAGAWLRMAWPFLAREDLHGVAPHLVVRARGGAEELATVLEKLPAELARIPGFPRFTASALRALVLPEETRVVVAQSPSRSHRRARTSRRA
jgi:hypothetical protein